MNDQRKFREKLDLNVNKYKIKKAKERESTSIEELTPRENDSFVESEPSEPSDFDRIERIEETKTKK